MYANGQVPTSLLIPRPSSGKDLCLMMPGTAAKFDTLTALGAPHGWTPLVSGPDDAYRSLGVQRYYWDTMPRGQAAYPGSSSHGGTFDFEDGRGPVETGALDIGNFEQIGRALFFDLATRAGFLPGYFDGRRGPDEPWHIFDLTPWAAPAAQPTPTSPEEDEMKNSYMWVRTPNGNLNAIFNRVSGYFEEFNSNEGGYNSAVARGSDLAGPTYEVSQSHYAVVKAACQAVRERTA